ncbi:MAG: replication-associated recombination protein A, partial [Ruminococcus sp.]|nr:replication-associated recombination protein A [Ruminococcus sp.]
SCAKKIAVGCGGDVRKAMNAVELSVTAAERDGDRRIVTEEIVSALVQRSAMRYDRDGDEHYDIVSAYQKSMRGSDPDAALHYLGRLLEAGDLPSACRRLMVCACEDVGLAYPQIIPIVKSCVDIAQAVGLPEARIPLADAVILVATAPKSNSGEQAIDRALGDIRRGNVGPIPRQLQNKHYDGEDNPNKGQHYRYPHDYPNHYTPQQYLPDLIKDSVYYHYGDNKTEQAFKAYWDTVKKKTKG